MNYGNLDNWSDESIWSGQTFTPNIKKLFSESDDNLSHYVETENNDWQIDDLNSSNKIEKEYSKDLMIEQTNYEQICQSLESINSIVCKRCMMYKKYEGKYI